VRLIIPLPKVYSAARAAWLLQSPAILMRTNHKTCPAAEVAPASTLAPLDLRQIFGRTAPLEVDLGCGDGTFLVARAEQNPARDFLGFDRLPGRARAAGRKIGQLCLTNARIVRWEILSGIQQLLPPASVDVFHLLFPDPWPKRRHENRRVVTPEFFSAIARALKPEGELRMATDQCEYFRLIETRAAEAPGFTPVSPEAAQSPATTFEERFRARGLEIHRLTLRKVSEPRKALASQRS
jgi:tRNA (guanine-N7-)-methyltransferase